MSAKKSIRFRGKRRKKETSQLDITSLLDILVILLVFLLKSYNSTGIIINVPEGITLPLSESKTINNDGVMVQVSATTIWVDDEKVLETEDGFDLKDPTQFDLARHQGSLIVPLYTELVKKRDTVKKIQTLSPEAKAFSGIANLVIDQALKYSFIKKIMYTCAEAGFRQYKFVVMGQEE